MHCGELHNTNSKEFIYSSKFDFFAPVAPIYLVVILRHVDDLPAGGLVRHRSVRRPLEPARNRRCFVGQTVQLTLNFCDFVSFERML